MKENLMNIPFVLKTSKVLLRRYREGEGKIVYELIRTNKDRLIDHFPKTVAQITDSQKGELFVRNKVVDWHSQRGYFFGIWDLTTQVYIGQISVKNIDWEIPRGELAYYLSSAYEGKGIMGEVVQIVVKFCFEKLQLKKLFIRTTPANARSSKLAERCGFTREGLIRSDFVKPDRSLGDVLYYGMTLQDYRMLQQ